jgi:hypothetical protein
MATFAQRLAAAQKYCLDFGLAAYCAFGREPASELPAVLKQHQEALKAVGLREAHIRPA